ncbi:MAG: phosphoglucomutase/phosphomannomutase family protein [Elusimicrobiales bacterium]
MMLETSKKLSFGTDGFRGIIALDFTYDNIRRIAQGFADLLAYRGGKVSKIKIFIGYDRRFLSERFAKEFAAVLVNNDFECVVSKTPITTPMVSYLTTTDYNYGVMITASHNGFLYNGVKIKHLGRSVLPSFTSELELYIENNKNVRVSRNLNREIHEADLRENYVRYLNSRFDIKKIVSSINGKIVVDFMYGSSADIAQMIFKGLQNVIMIRTKRDPLFGEISAPEPKEDKLKALKKAVVENNAVCGLALDGDGDRFACVDEKGNYLPPTIVAPLFLDYLVNLRGMKGKVVQAVSLGFLTRRIASEKNLIFEFTPVGFKYIADRMAEGDTLFGAEESGGYSWKGNIPERDGFVSMMMLCEIISFRKKKLSQIVEQLLAKYGSSCFIREDITLSKVIPSKYHFAVKIKSRLPKNIISYKIAEVITLDGIKVILDNDWWFLARPSGTEPLLRIYAEADSKSNTKKLISFAKDLVLGSI